METARPQVAGASHPARGNAYGARPGACGSSPPGLSDKADGPGGRVGPDHSMLMRTSNCLHSRPSSQVNLRRKPQLPARPGHCHIPRFRQLAIVALLRCSIQGWEHMRKSMTLMALALFCTSAAGQQIYQRTDAQGRVQFSQLPPANTPYQQRDIRAPAPIGGELREPAAPATVDPAQTEAQAQQRQQEQARAEQLRTYCQQLRTDLKTLQDNPRLRRTNADGE